MRLVVDTGVFSAALSPRRRAELEQHVAVLSGNQRFLAVVTVAELRYGSIVAGWGEERRRRLEAAIDATTVVPVTDALITQRRSSERSVERSDTRWPTLRMPTTSGSLQPLCTSMPHLVSADRVFSGVPGLNVLE